jgi:hypothetical protein
VNILKHALDIARTIGALAPMPPLVTEDELARALHAVDNAGRLDRFGQSTCHHRAKAERVMDYLRRDQ